MDDSEEPELRQYPAWRQAILDFKKEGFTYGMLVTHEWIDNAMGIKTLSPEDKVTEREHEKRQLERLAMFTPFRDELLSEHQMDLVAKQGQGYLIVMPQDQTELAQKQGIAEIRRGLKKMVKRLAGTNLAELTAEQRKKNADALASAAGIAKAFKEQRRIGNMLDET